MPLNADKRTDDEALKALTEFGEAPEKEQPWMPNIEVCTMIKYQLDRYSGLPGAELDAEIAPGTRLIITGTRDVTLSLTDVKGNSVLVENIPMGFLHRLTDAVGELTRFMNDHADRYEENVKCSPCQPGLVGMGYGGPPPMPPMPPNGPYATQALHPSVSVKATRAKIKKKV